jgi:hypothetical protein
MNPHITDIRHDRAFASRVARFANAGALADATKGLRDYTSAGSWTGYESAEQARVSARRGRPEAVAAAQALLDQVDAAGIQTYRPRWQADVMGALPDVPRYVAGAPDCMMRPDRRESESAPIKVFVSVCVSAGVSATGLQARGNALLALALKLSQSRPVELWLYADMGAGAGRGEKRAIIPMVAIPTGPMDLAAASYAMTAPGFLRQLCMTYAMPEGFTGDWAWDSSPSHSEAETAYEQRLKEALGASADDVVIYGGHIAHKLIAQPVEWVTEQLARYVNA